MNRTMMSSRSGGGSASIFVVVVFIVLASSLLPLPVRPETIHGTTILNWPYVHQRANGQFEGFCIDLLNELAPLMGVAYTLSVVPDGQYGGWVSGNGSVDGMIGQVMRDEADFAIGDLTVLSNRARFVDFTLPFMEYGLAALVRRDVLKSSPKAIRTFKDLSEQTAIPYGVKKHGANLPLFHDSPVVARMYSYMDTHPSVFVDGEREGLHRVKTQKYAFITESPFVEYVVQRDCDLVAIDDRRRNFQFEYAIAVAKDSPLKQRFDRAIRKLRTEGKIRELKNRYWNNPNRNCPDDPDYDPTLGKITGPPIQLSSKQNRIMVKPDREETSGRLTKGQYRARPHETVNDEDVELIRPRPDQKTRTRRPVFQPGHRNQGLLNSKINFFLLIIALALNLVTSSNRLTHL